MFSGIIELTATNSIEINGDVIADGQDSEGERGGGGSGGSVKLQTKSFLGSGSISANGGSSSGVTHQCPGGGGGGGRVVINHSWGWNTFTGRVRSVGGASKMECGGAGTVLYKDTTNGTYSLVVNNDFKCTPLRKRIDYSKLADDSRGTDSCRTYLFDPSATTHSHTFSEVDMNGEATVAFFRRNVDTFEQVITVEKTSGDKSGILNIGPLQVCICITVFFSMLI